jgi:hypothetical protein
MLLMSFESGGIQEWGGVRSADSSKCLFAPDFYRSRGIVIKQRGEYCVKESD